MKLRRPLIDINPDAPLRFHGCRISRDGSVFASTAPTVHGRTNRNREVLVGFVAKRPSTGAWVAWTEDRSVEFAADRQSDAAKALVDYVEEHQS